MTRQSQSTISSLSNTEVGVFISKILQLLGANDKNAPEDMQFIIENIKSVFGKWTTDEIIYAFRLGLENKIHSINMNLYDKPLGLVFISNILNAYRTQLRSPTMTEYNNKQIDKVELTPEQTEARNNEAIIRIIKQVWEYDKETLQIFPDMFYELAFDYFWKTKKLRPTKEKQEKIKEQAEREVEKYRKLKSAQLLGQGKIYQAREAIKSEMGLTHFSKKIAVTEYFKECKDMDIELNEII